MKTVAFAALAGVAAAASGPAASTHSPPAASSSGAPAPPAPSDSNFSLRAVSTRAEINGMFTTEEHSTDEGVTAIIMTQPGTSDDLKMSQMSFTDGSLVVNQPMRKGGSEMDYWTVGEVDPNTGMAVAQVKPAGYGKGFYLRNTSAVEPPPAGQASSATAYLPPNPTTFATMTASASFPRNPARRQANDANLPQYLGYKDPQGREGQFYACQKHGDVPLPPQGTGTIGTIRPTHTFHPISTGTVGTIRPTTTVFPVGPEGPGPVAPHDPPTSLMIGFGTQPVSRDCSQIFLQVVNDPSPL